MNVIEALVAFIFILIAIYLVYYVEFVRPKQKRLQAKEKVEHHGYTNPLQSLISEKTVASAYPLN